MEVKAIIPVDGFGEILVEDLVSFATTIRKMDNINEVYNLRVKINENEDLEFTYRS